MILFVSSREPQVSGHLALFSCLSLLAGVGLAGCSGGSCDPTVEDCSVEEASEPPETGPCAGDEFLSAVPTSWALLRHLDQEVFIYESPATKEGWYPQYTDSVSLVTWSDNGDGTYKQTEDMCGIQVSDIAVSKPDDSIVIQRTEFPKDPGQWADNGVWTATINKEEAGTECSVSVGLSSELSSGEIYYIWGAELSDPLKSVCPSKDDDGWVDTDDDGDLGFTTTSIVEGANPVGGGDFVVNTYICQRLVMAHASAPVSTGDTGYEILGSYSNVTNDQTMYGFDNKLFSDDDPEVQFQAEQLANSYWYMKALPVGATCQDALNAVMP